MRLYILSKYNYIKNEYDKKIVFNNQDYYKSDYVDGINSIIFKEIKEQHKQHKKNKKSKIIWL